ncbi:GNAT family N-acetyltransferase [Streptomyces sp. NPDC014684]|uniref:GNAT family N-acetyltransferase n=1 Tax=Streptomyces sp. NPDC014684 TaxID=3364880 RepID=UPI0036FD2D9E
MRFTAEQERLGDVLYPPRSAEGYRAWARDQAAAAPDADCFQLAVEAVDSGEIVGTIGVYHADPCAGWFEYGVMIGADHRHKGYASEAVVILLRFMFAERRYHKCQARVFAHNEGFAGTAPPARFRRGRPPPGACVLRWPAPRSRHNGNARQGVLSPPSRKRTVSTPPRHRDTRRGRLEVFVAQPRPFQMVY